MSNVYQPIISFPEDFTMQQLLDRIVPGYTAIFDEGISITNCVFNLSIVDVNFENSYYINFNIEK